MGEGKTNMFGKTYNTIGSTDSNFLIKTKGDLKVQWGGKFIDIIKNGKLNNNQNFVFKASSIDNITKDGIYIIQSDEEYQIYLSIEGDIIPLDQTGQKYVSYSQEQEATQEQKKTALTNIGFLYQSLDQAKASKIDNGVIYCLKEQKIYIIKNGNFIDYADSLISKNNQSSSDLYLEKLHLYGKDGSGFIDSQERLSILINSKPRLEISSDIKPTADITVPDIYSIHTENYTDNYGYKIYMQAGKSWLDIDNIRLRGSLLHQNYVEVTHQELLDLIENNLLEKGKNYKIKDYQNQWELTIDVVYQDVYQEESIIQKKNVRPIIVRANTINTLDLNSYYEDNPEWVLHYDYSYIESTPITDPDTRERSSKSAKGRITYLKDEYNNIANYDFKHLTFLKDGVRYYTFSDEQGHDISSEGGFRNNYINVNNVKISNPEFEISGENYLIFTSQVEDNTFENFQGNEIISGAFNKNIVKKDWKENTINGAVYGCTFSENVQNTSFSTSINLCTFNYSIINTDLFTKVSLNNCQVNSSISGNIEMPEMQLVQELQSDEIKQVQVISKENKQYLQITSDSLLAMPSGAIIMWYGNQVPYGWAICDGTNGTPNLIGKFVKAVSTADQIGDNPSDLNESNELVLTQEHLPKHSHPHKEHTHSLDGNISGTTGSSGDLTVSLDYSDYNWGIEGVTKTFVTSVAGEGVTTESGTVDGVSNIKTQGGNATGGSHTHSISLDTDGGVSLSSTKSQEEELVDSEWPNNPIKIEPRSYSLIFIMKL